jgi:hypothetical protein
MGKRWLFVNTGRLVLIPLFRRSEDGLRDKRGTIDGAVIDSRWSYIDFDT